MTKTFFMHVGKTAGTSVNAMLAHQFGDRFIDHIETKPGWQDRLDDFDCLSGHVHYPNFRDAVGNRPFRYITVVREPVAQFRSHLNWVKLLGQNPGLRANTGAHILKLSDELALLDLSDPEQAVEFLTREEDKGLRFAYFDNYQSRYFLGGYLHRRLTMADFRTAIYNMKRFHFVGLSESTPDIVEGVWRTIGVKSNITTLPRANVQGYDRNGDRSAWLKALGDWIAYDLALYKRAKVQQRCRSMRSAIRRLFN